MRELVSFGHFTAVDADRPLPTKGMALGALRQGIRFSTRNRYPMPASGQKDGGMRRVVLDFVAQLGEVHAQ